MVVGLCYEPNTKEHKKFRISTPRLGKDRKLDNRPLQGGNLLIHHIDSQRQDDTNDKTSLVYIEVQRMQLQ